MAQETSGTISKTILKNEMLPMLLNEQKRADRAYAYEEQAKRKAAELAAKKAAEDSKYIPKFDAATGADMWEHVVKPEDEKDVQAGLDLAKDQSIPRYQVGTYVNEMNRRRIQRAETSKQLKEGVLKTAEDLSRDKFRKITRDYGYNWAKTKNALTSPEEFAKEALADPNLIDFDAIGKFGQNYKIADYTYRDKGGNQKVVKMSPLFDYKYKKDPILGTEVPEVVGVNGAEAQKLIESNPDIEDAFKVWVGNRAKEYQSNRTFIDPVTGSPTMIRPDLAEDQAAKEFMEQSFGKYGKIEYGKQFAMPKKSGDGGESSKRFTMSISTPAGQGTHKLNVQALDSDGEGVITPSPQNQYASVGSKDDQTFVYDKEYSHPGNKKVRLLGQYDELKLSEYLEPLPDGGYLLKTGFNYSNPTERTLYFADKDLYFGGDEKRPYVRNGVRMNWTMVKKGDEVSPESALKRIADAKKTGKPSGVIEEPGYEVTANMYTGEDGDVDKKRPNVPIFIPLASAGEIKKHIQAEQQKKRKKPGPETTVDEYSGEEESLVR